MYSTLPFVAEEAHTVNVLCTSEIKSYLYLSVLVSAKLNTRYKLRKVHNVRLVQSLNLDEGLLLVGKVGLQKIILKCKELLLSLA